MQKPTKKRKSISRRTFLKALGLTGAAATVAPKQVLAKELYPYIIQPKGILPGISYYYNSVSKGSAAVMPTRNRQREARIVKVDGNPNSPLTKGGLDSAGFAQLHLHYHPDRIQGPMLSQPDGTKQYIKWDDAYGTIASQLGKVMKAGRGSRVRVVTGNEAGSMSSLLGNFCEAIGAPAPVTYEAIAHEHIAAANKLMFGREEAPTYRFDKADYIISFANDFMESYGNSVENSERFFNGFRPASFDEDGNVQEPTTGEKPFVYVGPRQSLTGISADAYLPVPPATEHYLALAMTHVILNEGLGRGASVSERESIRKLVSDYSPKNVAPAVGYSEDYITRMARSFAEAENPLALPGGVAFQHERGVEAVIAVNLLNHVVGATNNTVEYGAKPTWCVPNSYANMVEVVKDMSAGNVDVLITVDVNPSYSLPPGLGFDQAASKVGFHLHLTVLPDETTELADLVLPIHTPLEDHGDAKAQEGTYYLYKPSMEPIMEAFYRLKQPDFKLPSGERPQSAGAGDIFLTIAEKTGGKLADAFSVENYAAYVEAQWGSLHGQLGGGKDKAAFMEEAYQNGGVWSDAPVENVSLTGNISRIRLGKIEAPTEPRLLVYPHPQLGDGRHSNIPLLQEVPDSISSISWGTWIEISRASKLAEDWRFGKIGAVQANGMTRDIPLFAYSGMSVNAVAVPMGNGHRIVTPYCRELAGDEYIGFNAFDFVSADADKLSGGPLYANIKVDVAASSAKSTQVAYNAGSFDQLNRGLARAIAPGGGTIGYASQDAKRINSVRDHAGHGERSKMVKDEGGHGGGHGDSHNGNGHNGNGHNGDGHGDNGHGAAKAKDAHSNGNGSNGHGAGGGDGHGGGHGKEAATAAAATYSTKWTSEHYFSGKAPDEMGGPDGTDAVDLRDGHHAEPGNMRATDPGYPGHHGGDYDTIYDRQKYPNYKWGMVVDLDKCNGCGNCVTACHTENNVPVVGRARILEGREMSWLRFERYEVDTGEPTPRSLFTLMMCQQCEVAPCEPVCPVLAAYHNYEGLNVQVYNRCVGTRYCANNCTYKVRRFNYYSYKYPDFLAIGYNPDVYVRPAGVMEKCTFCIQRIREAKSDAKDKNRKVLDGEMQTACQQACPTGAITFGNLLDPESKVSKLARSERAYRALDETQGTKPSVIYLKRVVRTANQAVEQHEESHS